MAIEQENGDRNLYASAATIFNKTAAADGEYELEIKIGDGTKNIHTNASVLTLTVTCAGQIYGPEAINKDAGVVRLGRRTNRLFVASGEAISVTLLSNNSNDTDVDVTVTPRVVKADVVEWLGTAPNASINGRVQATFDRTRGM
jgi:hypothetical protein